MRSWVFAMILVALPGSVLAEVESPERVVKRYIDAVAEDPGAAALFYDDESLAKYKDLVLRALGDGPGDPLRLGGLSGEEARTLDPRTLYGRAFQPMPGGRRLNAIVLGSVAEGDRIAHVVVRSETEDDVAHQEGVVEVVTTVRIAGRWFVKMQELDTLEAMLGLGQGFEDLMRDIEKNASEE